MVAATVADNLRDELKDLMKKKDVIESLIEAYRSQGIIGEDLIDQEGND